MGIKTNLLSQLETDLRRTLSECADSGQPFVIELPHHRWSAIQALEPAEDDESTRESLESNAAFPALVAKSKASRRKPFQAGSGA